MPDARAFAFVCVCVILCDRITVSLHAHGPVIYVYVSAYAFVCSPQDRRTHLYYRMALTRTGIACVLYTAGVSYMGHRMYHLRMHACMHADSLVSICTVVCI